MGRTPGVAFSTQLSNRALGHGEEGNTSPKTRWKSSSKNTNMHYIQGIACYGKSMSPFTSFLSIIFIKLKPVLKLTPLLLITVCHLPTPIYNWSHHTTPPGPSESKHWIEWTLSMLRAERSHRQLTLCCPRYVHEEYWGWQPQYLWWRATTYRKSSCRRIWM